MQIELFNFSKKRNSTKIPTGTGTIKTVVLKNDTSLNSPKFEITDVDYSWNYLKWNGNYYFIRDIIKGNLNVHVIDCEIDVLASYRSDILGYTAFVKRSASAYNVNLNDSLIASGQQVIQEVAEGTIIDNDLNSTPHYALRTASGDGIRTYWLSYTQLYSVLDYMFTQANIVDVITDAFVNFFVNPEDYILSLKFFRCLAKNTGTSTVKFGFFDTEVSADYVSPLEPYGHYTKTLTIPARYYNDFRDFSPAYTKCLIHFPGYGLFELDPIYLQSQLSVTYTIDYYTGGCTIRLFSDSKIIAKLQGKLGADIQISASHVSGSGIVGGALEVGAGVLGQNPMMLAKGALDLSQSLLSPQVNTIGGQDTISNIVSNPATVSIYVRRMASAGIPLTEKGRPYCQNALLGNLSGYCECLNASVDTSADLAMKEQINDVLNSGFYIE